MDNGTVNKYGTEIELRARLEAAIGEIALEAFSSEGELYELYNRSKIKMSFVILEAFNSFF